MATRRSLASGAVLALLGTAGAVAAPPHGDSTDAELIRLCGEHEALEWQYRRIIGSCKTIEAEHAADPSLDRIRKQQEPLLNRICAMPCTTHAGVVALAGALTAWDAESLVDEDDENEDVDTRLIGAMVRSLLAGRA